MSQASIATFNAFLADNPIGNQLREEERVREERNQEARRRIMQRPPVVTLQMRNRRQELIDHVESGGGVARVGTTDEENEIFAHRVGQALQLIAATREYQLT